MNSMTFQLESAKVLNDRIRNEVARTKHPFTTDIDISSKAFWMSPMEDRLKAYARLRAEAPVSFHPPIEVPFDYNQEGFWAVVKADHVQEVARRDEDFISGLGNTIDATPYPLPFFFHLQDGILHKRNRALVSSAFAPKAVSRMLDDVHAVAKEIVDGVAGGGEMNFVSECAAPLPSKVVSRIMGVPESERETFSRMGRSRDQVFSPEHSEYQDPVEKFFQTATYFHELGRELAAFRRTNPADNDVMTRLVQAEVDGLRLSDEDIGGFMFLMATAASGTTVNTASNSLIALDRNPVQDAWLKEDITGRIGTAVEEFLRFSPPAIGHGRVASRDLEFHGAQIKKGDRVGIYYVSANRDEDKYERPNEFDLSRQPNPHYTFGAGGVHFCLGNRIASAMLRSLFSELLSRTDVSIVGEPIYTPSPSSHPVSYLPVSIK